VVKTEKGGCGEKKALTSHLHHQTHKKKGENFVEEKMLNGGKTTKKKEALKKRPKQKERSYVPKGCTKKGPGGGH